MTRSRRACSAPAVVILMLAPAAMMAQGFDFESVRGDFFAGAAGDAAALQRAMAATEQALAENPKAAQALGDVHSRQGRTADAERYYALIQQKLPDTEYATRAAEWMRTRQPLPAERTACVGCHIETR